MHCMYVVSYRLCTETAPALPRFAPTAVPPSSPTPAPAAAPTAGLPAAAPRAAPAAAPRSVPIVAPLTVLSVVTLSVFVPVCCAAHWRHIESSTWNCSKFLPSPGSTMTLGPDGIDAQALSSSTLMRIKARDDVLIIGP